MPNMTTTRSHDDARVLFDTMAGEYEDRVEQRQSSFSTLIFQRRIAIVQDFINRCPPSGAVLDYGMGPAVFAPHCVGRGMRYTGVDIAPEMVRLAQNMNLPRAEFVVSDLEGLKPWRGKMDLTLAIGLIDYLEHPEEGIATLASCVKPGGRIVISFRNRNSVPRMVRDTSKVIWRAVGLPTDSGHNAFASSVHEHSFSFSRNLKPWLAKRGFGEFDVRYFNCSPLFFNFPLPQPILKKWYKLDTAISGRGTRMMCSGGVMIAQRKLS